MERLGTGAGNFAASDGITLSAKEPHGACNVYIFTTDSGGSGDRRFIFDNDGGLWSDGASGGSQGANTINAKSVYDDGSLLSCYVFDLVLDGVVETKKWDAKVPDDVVSEKYHGDDETVISPRRTVFRGHEPMRKFVARAGTPHDPLTLDGYARHWREKRHLSSMPNEVNFDPVNGKMSAGEWVQRLVETVEIQAVLIEELNQRTKNAAAPRSATVATAPSARLRGAGEIILLTDLSGGPALAYSDGANWRGVADNAVIA